MGRMLGIDVDVDVGVGVGVGVDSLIALAAIVALVGSGTLGWPEVEQGTRHAMGGCCCCLVAFVVFLTELLSHTASAALLIPIFLGVASAFDCRRNCSPPPSR